MSSIVNSIYNYLSPTVAFPQKEARDSEYSAWQKPPAAEARYLEPSTNESSVQVGSSNVVLDTIAKIVALPHKIFSFTGQDTSREVSEGTIHIVKDYLHRNQLDHVKVVANLYDPAMVWQRTWTNPRTMLITKLFSGSLNALGQTMVPQRILGGGVNVYDQYTDVITLNNNDVSMALFAAAQAKGTAMRRNPIIYNSVKDFCPLMTPTQNVYCSKDVVSYLKNYGKAEDLQTAYKALGTSSGIDFAVDVIANPIFSLAITAVSTYLLKGHVFSQVKPIFGESFSDLFARSMKASLKDQASGYLFASPFIATCALVGYYYGKSLTNEMQAKETVPSKP